MLQFFRCKHFEIDIPEKRYPFILIAVIRDSRHRLILSSRGSNRSNLLGATRSSVNKILRTKNRFD